MRIENKHCIITGGTAGIGFEVARLMLQAGASVTVCGRDGLRLDRAIAGLPGARGVIADIAQPAGRQRLVDEMTAVGGLDILVNNAAIQFRDQFSRCAEERIERQLLVNLVAPLLLTRAVLPELERFGGTVVNITSGLAWAPAQDACVYSASKAGLRSFTRGLRTATRNSGVRVVEVIPPLVDTEMTGGRHGKKMSALAVAEAIVRGLQADRSEIFVGAASWIPLLSRIAPSILERKMNAS